MTECAAICRKKIPAEKCTKAVYFPKRSLCLMAMEDSGGSFDVASYPSLVNDTVQLIDFNQKVTNFVVGNFYYSVNIH